MCLSSFHCFIFQVARRHSDANSVVDIAADAGLAKKMPKPGFSLQEALAIAKAGLRPKMDKAVEIKLAFKPSRETYLSILSRFNQKKIIRRASNIDFCVSMES